MTGFPTTSADRACVLLFSIQTSDAECSPERVLQQVATCAGDNKLFLRCVNQGNPGAKRQCECLNLNKDMQECLDPCWSAVYNSLCTGRWTPRKHGLWILNGAWLAAVFARIFGKQQLMIADFKLRTVYSSFFLNASPLPLFCLFEPQ